VDQVLVVVESPAKARTISKYLGDGYRVKASVGHIRDLPKKELGIDVENGFKPKYVTVRDKSKIIKELRQEANKSSQILLATDMDREGEAIAWHLKEILDKSGLPIKRIIFNEITREALAAAVSAPNDIDTNKVNAQQARRVVDRLVGYLVSPVLWRLFYMGLSAGRVQSVGLRLIIEREQQIRDFEPREYWTIEGTLSTADGETFPAKLVKVDGAKPEIPDGEKAESLLGDLRGSALTVTDVRRKEKKRNPGPPYITSMLQREAASRLGFSPKKTMLIAQQLYEGVELGNEGSVGLISYMRTDSTRVSDEAYRRGTEFIGRQFGPEFVYKGRRGFKKAKQSQDAHEAIRPTDCHRTPEQLKKYLTKDQASLYALVWSRFLASLAAPAVYEIREADIRAGDRFMLKASGRRLARAGFLKIMPDRKTEEETWIPDLSKGDELSALDLGASQHFTEAPPRFTEASLIKELEERGIGRPSTYASIISIIQARDYARKEKGSLYPTPLGEQVWKTLEQLFRDIFEIGFTARMEEELDKVEEAKEDWQDVVSQVYKPLVFDLEKINEKGEDLKQLVQEETDEVCDNCGRKLVKKWGKNGPFLACPGYPKCRFTKSLEKDEEIGRICPKCGGNLIYKNGRFGKFVACQNYPECRYTEAATLGIKCPVEGCGGEIVEKRTRRGKIFYGCSKYPECTYASWDKPTSERCRNCGEAYLVEKESKKKGRYLRCPSCKAEFSP
jgi:DNA topoisomerase-1